MGNLIKFASKNDFKLKLITCEPPQYNEKSRNFISLFNIKREKF